jgi:hypothetical protein
MPQIPAVTKTILANLIATSTSHPIVQGGRPT